MFNLEFNTRQELALLRREIMVEDNDHQYKATYDKDVYYRELESVRLIYLFFGFLRLVAVISFRCGLISKQLEVLSFQGVTQVCHNSWEFGFFNNRGLNSFNVKLFNQGVCLPLLGACYHDKEFIIYDQIYPLMIPTEIDIQTIDDLLLFGNGRGNNLNFDPLDQFQAERLLELIQKLLSIYLSNSNAPIGGNWGLLGFGFQYRNGIIIYNQFQKLKGSQTFIGINQLPEDFLTELEVLEPQSHLFYDRCKLLNLDPSEVMTIKQTDQDNNLGFQFNQRILAKDEYLSEPGSLAADILQSFSYNQYVEVRSVWSQKSIQQDQINIPEISKQRRLKKRQTKSWSMQIQQESYQVKTLTRKTKGKRPSRKRQMKIMLQYVDSTRQKYHNRKLKRIPARKNKRKQKQKKFFHTSPSTFYPSVEDDIDDGNDDEINVTSVKTRLKRKKVYDTNILDYERQSNTLEIQDSQLFIKDTNGIQPIRQRKTIHKLSINRIDLSNLVYRNDFPVSITKNYEYIQQELKRLTNPSKLLKICKSIIINYLSQITPITRFNILYLKQLCDCYLILPNNRQLLQNFISYFLKVQFAKLVAITTYYIVEQKYDDKNSISVILQEFQGMMISGARDQFKKLMEAIKLQTIIEQFLVDFFVDIPIHNTNNNAGNSLNIVSNYSKTRKSQSSYFTVKSFKVIYSLIFQYGNIIQSLISCRLVEKMLYSRGLFKKQSTSFQQYTTCIGVYKKFVARLSPSQLDNTLYLLIDIQKKYPTFWTFEQFSMFFSMVDHPKKTVTVHIQNYIKQCLNIYITQQISVNTQQYKQLTNQILRQTILGNIKFKQISSYWDSIFLITAKTMSQYFLFTNPYFYKLVMTQISTMKITDNNYKQASEFILDSLKFLVNSQRQSFQKKFQSPSQIILTQYKQISKLKSIQYEKYQQQNRMVQFRSFRTNKQYVVTSVLRIYQRLFEYSDIPEMLPLKLKILFQDKMLVEILSKTDIVWRQTKLILMKIMSDLFTKPNISFMQTNNVEVYINNQNSEDDELSDLIMRQNKYKNYYNYILELLLNEYKFMDKSILNYPLIINIKSKPLILAQFKAHACKLTLKIIVEKAVIQELVRNCDNIMSNKYEYMYQQCGEGSPYLFCYKIYQGSIETFLGWNQFKKTILSQFFLNEIAYLIINMSFFPSLQQQRNYLISLQNNALRYQVNNTFWGSFVGECQINHKQQMPIEYYLQLLGRLDIQLKFFDNYLKKHERDLIKIKNTTSKPVHVYLFTIDLLYVILSNQPNTYPSKLDVLFNIVVPPQFQFNDPYFLKNCLSNRTIILKLSKLLALLVTKPQSSQSLISFVIRLIKFNVQLLIQSINLVKNKQNDLYQISNDTYIQNYIQVCEQSYQQNHIEYTLDSYQTSFGLILDQLHKCNKIDEKMRYIICRLVLDRLINTSTIFKRYFQEYKIQRITQKYLNKM